MAEEDTRRTRQGLDRQEWGRRAEELAARFLQQRGYRILARNYRTLRAEVDLVAEDEGHLVFVEVKARRGRSYGRAVEAVDIRKQRRLTAAALDFWARHPGQRGKAVRFDVIALEGGPAPNHPRLRWIADAFRPGDGPW